MKNTNHTADLDNINNKRVETTRKRVAHAIRLLNNPVACLKDGRLVETAQEDIAHALNLLEAGLEEMNWACEYFEWDTMICDDIMKACRNLGVCLAILEDPDDEDYDIDVAGYEGDDAVAILGMALATLTRWFDDDADASEI